MSAAPFGYPPGTLDAAGRVAVDAACTVCKYNLRSLEPAGFCPECGQPVAVSLREWGRYLRHAPLPYLQKLVRGTRLIVWAVIISIVGSVALWVGSLIVAAQVSAAFRAAGGATLPQPILLVNVASWVLSLGVMVMIAIGLVNFTTRDPRELDKPEPRFAARRMVRYALVGLPLTFLAAVVMGVMATFAGAVQAPAMAFGGVMIATIVIGLLHGLNYVVLVLAGLRHARHLMRQVPNPGLASFATVLFWGACVVGILTIAWVVLLFGTVTTLIPAPAAGMVTTTAPTSFPTTPGAVGYTVIVTHDDGSTTSATYSTTTGSAPLPATVPANAVVIPSVPPPAVATPATGVVMIAAGAAVILGGCGALVLWIAALIFLISLHRELGRTLKAGMAESGAIADA